MSDTETLQLQHEGRGPYENRIPWNPRTVADRPLIMVNVLLAQRVLCAAGAEVDYRGPVVNELQQPIAGATAAMIPATEDQNRQFVAEPVRYIQSSGDLQ